MTDKILVPDLPPPYTISENSIWGMNSIRNKLEYVGFATPRIAVTEANIEKVCGELELNKSKPIIFVHVRPAGNPHAPGTPCH